MNKRIVELRKSRELSQTEFAKSINLTQNFLSLLETGNRQASERTISDICRVYNVNESWLRTGEGDMFLSMTKEQELAHLTKKIFNEEIPIEVSALIKVLSEMTDEEFAMFTRFVNKYMTKLEEEKENLPE